MGKSEGEMKKQTWGKFTCPKCGGIQIEERNCYGGNYHHWRCSNCNFTELDSDRTLRFAREHPEYLEPYMRKCLGV